MIIALSDEPRAFLLTALASIPRAFPETCPFSWTIDLNDAQPAIKAVIYDVSENDAARVFREFFADATVTRITDSQDDIDAAIYDFDVWYGCMPRQQKAEESAGDGAYVPGFWERLACVFLPRPVLPTTKSAAPATETAL